MGKAFTIDDQTQHHRVVFGSLTQIEMAQQTLPGRFLVNRDIVPVGKTAYTVGDFSKDMGLQRAVPAGNDGVGARREKAGKAAVFIIKVYFVLWCTSFHNVCVCDWLAADY